MKNINEPGACIIAIFVSELMSAVVLSISKATYKKIRTQSSATLKQVFQLLYANSALQLLDLYYEVMQPLDDNANQDDTLNP